jgi:hypothetical protein
MLELFATLELAVRSALIDAYNCGEQRQECGGVIYESAAGYSYTVPITDHKSFGVTIPYLYSVDPPPGAHRVADYHNHICSSHNASFAAYFSGGDVAVNKGFHLVGYMLDGCTGNIHRFDPAGDPVDDEEVDFKPHPDGTVKPPFFLTIGHISGWIDIYE